MNRLHVEGHVRCRQAERRLLAMPLDAADDVVIAKGLQAADILFAFLFGMAAMLVLICVTLP